MSRTVRAEAPLVNTAYTPKATVRYLELYYDLKAELIDGDAAVRLTGPEDQVTSALTELWPADVAADVPVEPV